MSDYLDVDVFVFGAYRGKTRCHKDSLLGRLAEGNYTEAMEKARELTREIVAICETAPPEVNDD